MLTRSSTCRSAGSSVLKSKCVMRVEVRLLADVLAVEDLAEASRTASSRRAASQLISSLEVGRAVDEPEVARVQVVEEPLAPELLQQRLVARAARVRFGMIDS